MADEISKLVEESRGKQPVAGERNTPTRAQQALDAPVVPSELLSGDEIARVARMCHDVNSLYQKLIGEEAAPPWPEAPEAMRLSVISGVRSTLDDPTITPLELHDKWLSEKLRAGWRYGETKDHEAKTHPNLLPYFELPLEQRRKDFLFRAIVSAMVVDDSDKGSGVAAAVMKRIAQQRQR